MSNILGSVEKYYIFFTTVIRPQRRLAQGTYMKKGGKFWPNTGSHIKERQNGDFERNLPIFHSFLAHFRPMVPHLPFFGPHAYGICLFPPISVYFPPILYLKWYPILVINSSMEPIWCFSPACLRILPIFHLTFCPYSAGPVLPGLCVVCTMRNSRALTLLSSQSWELTAWQSIINVVTNKLPLMPSYTRLQYLHTCFAFLHAKHEGKTEVFPQKTMLLALWILRDSLMTKNKKCTLYFPCVSHRYIWKSSRARINL